MAAAGARGNTLAGMARVLHVDDLAEAHTSFGNLRALLNGRDGTDGPAIHLRPGDRVVLFIGRETKPT